MTGHLLSTYYLPFIILVLGAGNIKLRYDPLSVETLSLTAL